MVYLWLSLMGMVMTRLQLGSSSGLWNWFTYGWRSASSALGGGGWGAGGCISGGWRGAGRAEVRAQARQQLKGQVQPGKGEG
jgi:hypothetical protein